VRALKYDGWHTTANDMASRMARLSFPSDVLREAPVLVPVPLFPARERERGYNQSSLLAVALSRRWDLQVVLDCLRRCRTTQSQTRLSAAERARNVSGAFSVQPTAAALLRGKHIMLVDDVVTTASTMNECAATLFGGGARIVSYVTFGRAHAAGDAL
jgi:ComF family protein